jgi:hypothetical protein
MAAFTSAITERWIEGNKAYARGTFESSAGAAGGNIDTGLHRCEFIAMTPTSATSPAVQCAVNETLPVLGSAVTIVTTANVAGYWEAFGDSHA